MKTTTKNQKAKGDCSPATCSGKYDDAQVAREIRATAEATAKPLTSAKVKINLDIHPIFW